jgi:hypothetical protein
MVANAVSSSNGFGATAGAESFRSVNFDVNDLMVCGSEGLRKPGFETSCFNGRPARACGGQRITWRRSDVLDSLAQKLSKVRGNKGLRV